MLFIIKADTLLINKNLTGLLLSGNFNKKTTKLKPVIIKKINNINKPLDASLQMNNAS